MTEYPLEERKISEDEMIAEEPELEDIKDEKPKKNIIAS